MALMLSPRLRKRTGRYCPRRGDARVQSSKNLARKLRRNVEQRVDPAIAQIAHGDAFIVVGNRVERGSVDGDGLAHLAHFNRGDAVVLIDDTHMKMFDLSAKGVAEHDQLHQRHDDRNDHQHRAAPEAAKIAFNDGPDSVHIAFYLLPVNDDGTVGSIWGLQGIA